MSRYSSAAGFESIALQERGDFWIDALILPRACCRATLRGACVLEVGQMWGSRIVVCNNLMPFTSNESGTNREWISTDPVEIPRCFLEFELILCLVPIVFNGSHVLARITHVTLGTELIFPQRTLASAG